MPAFKKNWAAKRICEIVGVERLNPKEDTLTSLEMLYVLTWLTITSDITYLIQKRVEGHALWRRRDLLKRIKEEKRIRDMQRMERRITSTGSGHTA